MTAKLARPDAGSSTTSLIWPRLSPWASLTCASITWLNIHGLDAAAAVLWVLCLIPASSASKEAEQSEPPAHSAMRGSNVLAFIFHPLVCCLVLLNAIGQ